MGFIPTVVPPHLPDIANGLILSSIRGLRNGIVCGVRIRLPYVIQAATYAVLYRDEKYVLVEGLPLYHDSRYMPLTDSH